MELLSPHGRDGCSGTRTQRGSHSMTAFIDQRMNPSTLCHPALTPEDPEELKELTGFVAKDTPAERGLNHSKPTREGRAAEPIPSRLQADGTGAAP